MTAYGAAVSEHEDTIETKLAELRKRLTHLSGALDVDPRAIEILWLQDQVEYLARAVVASTQSPKPQEWQLEGPRVGCILAALWALAPAPPSLPDS